MPDIHPTCDSPPQPPAFVAPDAFFENLKVSFTSEVSLMSSTDNMFPLLFLKL